MTHAAPDRGDIAWINFSPQAGHEQAERRPALVLSPQRYNARSGFALVCPITSRVKNYPFEVPLGGESQTGGVVIADQIHCFDWRARSLEFRERAPDGVIDEVLARIAALLS